MIASRTPRTRIERDLSITRKQPKAAKLPCATEHAEQVALMRWADLESRKYPELELIMAVPNGARTSMSVAVRLKAEGLRAGFPDITLPVARGNYHGMMIEMKRLRGGTVSDAQKWWIDGLRNQGYYAIVCRGWKEAAIAIESYLTVLPKPILLREN